MSPEQPFRPFRRNETRSRNGTVCCGGARLRYQGYGSNDKVVMGRTLIDTTDFGDVPQPCTYARLPKADLFTF